MLLGIEAFGLECAGCFDVLALILRFGSTRIQNQFEFRQHRLNSTWNYLSRAFSAVGVEQLTPTVWLAENNFTPIFDIGNLGSNPNRST